MPSAAISPDIKLNTDTIEYQIKLCIDDYCEQYGLDLSDYKQRSNIKHLELANILRYIYKKLLKPNIKLKNNQRSIIDYSDNEQLYIMAECFIDICTFFNKSLGLYWFSQFIGCDYQTILNWEQEPRESNPARFEILKAIKLYNRDSLIALLKDSTVGAIAIANNDIETGLKWSENNATQITNNSVFVLPSERRKMLNNAQEPVTVSPLPVSVRDPVDV